MSSSIQSRLSKDSYFRMGYFYQAEGDLQAAAECYMQSIENNPNPEAHTFLGWVLSSIGEVEQGKKALELDPDFGNALNDLGVYYTLKLNYKKAIPFLKRACKSKNYDRLEYPHYNLAKIYLQQNLLGYAVRELKASLKINSSFGSALELLERAEKKLN
jgi:tetratricopeptide (TPR) repeat protein